MSTAKAAPRKLKVGDKVIFMLHDYTCYQGSIKRNVWHEGEVDHIYFDGELAIEFYHSMHNLTLLKYVHSNNLLLGRITIIRKVA